LNPLFIMKSHGNSCKPIIYHFVLNCKETLQPALHYSADVCTFALGTGSCLSYFARG
uniref:Uncharacterized protein n=1 Tax=Amazona collaria TaxID=241587 RepID=A0A8B9G1Y7_9PSIT